jgi:hypothetical protein
VAGGVWFLIAGWMWLGRYLFCNDPAYIETVFLALIGGWVASAAALGYVRVRGHVVWPWTLAWFGLSTAGFATVVYTGPDPGNCGLF